MGQRIFPEFNYHIRAYILLLSPVFAAVMALIAYDRRPLLDSRGVCFFLLLVAVQAAHEATALAQWSAYKSVLAQALAAPGPVAAPLSESAAAAGRPAAAPAPEFAWVAPYQSMVLRLPGGALRRRVLLSQSNGFTPFVCRDRPILQRDKPPEIDPAVYAAVLDDVCRKNPV
jgi:predicted component of type VI protein secretion system